MFLQFSIKALILWRPSCWIGIFMSPRTKDRLPNGNFEQKSLMGATGPKTFQNGGSDKWYKCIWDVWRYFRWFQLDAVKVTFQGIKGAGLLESILPEPEATRTSTEETSTCLVCLVFQPFGHLKKHLVSRPCFCICKHSPTPIQLSFTSFEQWLSALIWPDHLMFKKCQEKSLEIQLRFNGFVTSMPGHMNSLRWCTCPWYIHQLALEFYSAWWPGRSTQSLWWRAEGAAYVKGEEKNGKDWQGVKREIDRCQMLGCLSLFPFHWKTPPRKFAVLLSVNGGGTGFIMTSSRWGFHVIRTVHDVHLLQSLAVIHLDPYG